EPGRLSPKTGRQGRQELSTPLERASCPHPGPAAPSPLAPRPGPLRAARSAALHRGLDRRAELVAEDVKCLPATLLSGLQPHHPPRVRASCPHPGPASPAPPAAGPGPLRAATSAALHQGLDQRAELVVEAVKGLPATFLIGLQPHRPQVGQIFPCQ